MVDVSRVQAVWTGAGVTGPSMSVFHTIGLGGDLATEIRALYQAIRDAIPTAMSITVDGAGESYDSVTGEFKGIWTMTTPPAVVTGNNTGSFAAGAGGRFVWTTNGVTNRRRVRGSTFVVPLGNNAFNTSGGVQLGTGTGTTAAAAFVAATAGEFVIWTRPVGGAGGKVSEVVSGRMATEPTSLRSRRT